MKSQAILKIPALALAGFIALFMTGCEHYQILLMEPANVAQPITSKPVQVNYPPLAYLLSRQDDRLVMQILNPTLAPVTLLSQGSYLVAPAGETHPLRGAIIAPHSYVPLIFPPPPRVYHPYPSYSLGFGYGPGWPGPFVGAGYYGGFYGPPPPPYYVSYPADIWGWDKGDVRVTLVYQQTNPTNTFEHRFLFTKQKVK